MFLALLGGAGLVLGRCAVVGNLHAELLGQVLYGLHEGHARVFHQELDGIAAFATAKTVEELLGRADAERGRLFCMKGAQPHEIGAALLQLHRAADDLDHVGAGE